MVTIRYVNLFIDYNFTISTTIITISYTFSQSKKVYIISFYHPHPPHSLLYSMKQYFEYMPQSKDVEKSLRSKC